jgi:hypothetical protein
VIGHRVAALLFGAVLVWLQAQPGEGAQSSSRGLPAQIRADLNKLYPGWRFAEIGAALRPLPRGRAVDWVSGDFNGDGRPDYAVQIVRPGREVNSQTVVAFLGRGRGYERLVVLAFLRNHETYLGRVRRGERRPDLETDPSGGSRFVLRTDAIDVIYGGQASHTCVYEGGKFRCIITRG